MSDEEKKAIELLKKLQKKTPYIIWGDGTPYNKSNQIQIILNVIDKQQNEIEEKTTILLAGAEKVKQLEKEIEREKQYTDFYKDLCNKQQKEIEELRKNKKDNIQVVYGGRRFGTEGMVVKDYISKDKIKELKEKVEKEMISNPYDFSYMINELLEEN